MVGIVEWELCELRRRLSFLQSDGGYKDVRVVVVEFGGEVVGIWMDGYDDDVDYYYSRSREDEWIGFYVYFSPSRLPPA